MKKTYCVEDTRNNGEMKVEIDHDVLTEEKLHEINNFWSRAKERLDAEGGNVLHAVLKDLLADVLAIQLEGGLNTHGVVQSFDWDATYGRQGIEGWPKMDGSTGIKIIDVVGLEFEPSDMTIKEVTA